MKSKSLDEQWKITNYFLKMEQHRECGGKRLFGGELWAHVKSCETSIPEPKLKMTEVKL